MAGTGRKRRGEIVRAVFQVLLDKPDGLPAQEVLRRVETICPPTAFEQQDYPNKPGLRRYEKTVRFSTISSAKAGWLVKANGRWSVSPLGKDAYTKFPTPEAFIDEAWRLYKAWAGTRPPVTEEEAEEREEAASTTIEEAVESAWSGIRDYVAKMPPYKFQDLVAGLLRAMGYHVSWVAPPGPDRGLDIIAFSDPLGAQAPRIKVQVKRQDQSVNAEKFRSFLSTIGEGDIGIFVCSGGFTSDAETEARHEKRRVTLITLEALIELWIRHYDGLAEEDRQRLPLKPVYFLAQTE